MDYLISIQLPEKHSNFVPSIRETSGLAVLLFRPLPEDAPWFTSKTANVWNLQK